MKRAPRTQQVSPGGQSAPAPIFHTLFAPIDGVSSPDYEPEPIAKIFVTRFESRGQVQALRPFRPEELQDNASVYQRFGGGTYELVARREDGTIYAKRLITLEGDPKSMNGEPVAPPVGAAPNPNAPIAPPTLPAPSSASETMLHYMMQMNMQQQQMMGNVLVAMLGGNKADAQEQARAMQATMQTTIEMVKATMPQAQPPATPVSPIATLKELLEVQKLIQPAPPTPPKPKEETTSDIISALGGALGPFMQLAANAAGASPAVQQAAAAVGGAMQG